MSYKEAAPWNIAESREIAEQTKVELAILLNIERSLRLALQWMTQDYGNRRRLSTLRFQTASFERQLARVHLVADHGGGMNLIAEVSPHLANEVAALGVEGASLRDGLERIIVRLEHAIPNDTAELEEVCLELGRFLDTLRTHGEKECELLQRSFAQEEGGSG